MSEVEVMESDRILVRDEMVPIELQEQLAELAGRPIWGFGWHSNGRQDRYCFWHAHFAGSNGKSRLGCAQELSENQSAAPVMALWRFLEAGILQGHEPIRVYANGHTYGIEGYVHTDSNDEENYFTTIYYAHRVWRKNWSGELLFFSRADDEIVKAVLPRPGRLVSFPGSIPHKAQAPSRECPELRVSIVVKSQLAKGRASDA